MFFISLVLLASEPLPDLNYELNVQKDTVSYEEVAGDNSFRLVTSPNRTTSSSEIQIQKWEYQEGEELEDN